MDTQFDSMITTSEATPSPADLEISSLREKLRQRSAEITTLTRLLFDKDDQIASERQAAMTARKELAELHEKMARQRSELLDLKGAYVRAATFIAMSRYGHRPDQKLDPKRLEWLAQVLTDQGFISPDWYLTEYKDVAAATLDAAIHFVQYGAREGRMPAENFIEMFDAGLKDVYLCTTSR